MGGWIEEKRGRSALYERRRRGDCLVLWWVVVGLGSDRWVGCCRCLKPPPRPIYTHIAITNRPTTRPQPPTVPPSIHHPPTNRPQPHPTDDRPSIHPSPTNHQPPGHSHNPPCVPTLRIPLLALHRPPGVQQEEALLLELLRLEVVVPTLEDRAGRLGWGVWGVGGVGWMNG